MANTHNPAGLDPEATLQSLNTSVAGLSRADALQRRANFGPNRVEAAARNPWWLALLGEFFNFFALILWLAAGLAFWAEQLETGQGMQVLGLAIVGVIVINGVFSYWQAHRAERALEALRRMLPEQVSVRRDGVVIAAPASELVPGDIVLLGEGARVPADCRILEAWGLRVNLATLTGEARPKARTAATDPAPDPLAARSLLLAGSTIVGGQCTAVVYATGMATEFGAIARLTQAAGATDSPLQREIRRVSRLVAVFAVSLGVVFFGLGRIVGLSFWSSFMFAIGIIVANVPEGLMPTVTLALALATQRMARRNALVRRLPAVEALGSATVIVTDKTGTLTQNRMTVRELFVDGRHHPASDRWPRGAELHLRTIARTCHSLHFHEGDAQPVGDPMEVALWLFAGTTPEIGLRCGEIPFDAERRRMSVLTRREDGETLLWCKGAPESVLPLCRSLRRGEAVTPIDADVEVELRRAHEDMVERGLRVLALAWRSFPSGVPAAEADLEFCGLIGLEDPPREGVREAVSRCHGAGLKVIMVTGDHPRTALALAREIELVRGGTPRIVTGENLRDLSAASLRLALEAPEILFARVSAEQKMRVVDALQARGELVAVTGDGVNDAPALKRADIGIAMGMSGTDVAREAADIVLLDDHFATIVNAIEEGRAVFDNLRKFLTYILASNIPEIVPYLAFVLFRIPLPLTVIQILAVDLGTDMLPALALGAEAPASDTMTRPPRPRSERLLSWGVLARAYLFIGPIQAVAAMSAFLVVLHSAGWTYGQALGPRDALYLSATTACFAAIVLGQVANVFVCRHALLPAWHSPPFRNRLLALGILVEIGLLLVIVYSPLGNWLLATRAIDCEAWLVGLAGAVLLALLEEARKGWLRRRRGPISRSLSFH